MSIIGTIPDKDFELGRDLIQQIRNEGGIDHFRRGQFECYNL